MKSCKLDDFGFVLIEECLCVRDESLCSIITDHGTLVGKNVNIFLSTKVETTILASQMNHVFKYMLTSTRLRTGFDRAIDGYKKVNFNN